MSFQGTLCMVPIAFILPGLIQLKVESGPLWSAAKLPALFLVITGIATLVVSLVIIAESVRFMLDDSIGVTNLLSVFLSATSWVWFQQQGDALLHHRRESVDCDQAMNMMMYFPLRGSQSYICILHSDRARNTNLDSITHEIFGHSWTRRVPFGKW